MSDRRVHPRVKALHSVLFLTSVYQIPGLAMTVDLSVGGARIETAYCMIHGQVIKLSLAIHHQAIGCMGEVVHVLLGERPIAGIRFEGMSEQNRSYLEAYVSQMREEKNPGDEIN